MTFEDGQRIARNIQSAADTASVAADRIETVVQTFRQLFEDGYGGNALRLIELLEKDQSKALANARALIAIKARLDGEWTNPDLVAIGPLGLELRDIQEIIKHYDV